MVYNTIVHEPKKYGTVPTVLSCRNPLVRSFEYFVFDFCLTLCRVCALQSPPGAGVRSNASARRRVSAVVLRHTPALFGRTARKPLAYRWPGQIKLAQGGAGHIGEPRVYDLPVNQSMFNRVKSTASVASGSFYRLYEPTATLARH